MSNEEENKVINSESISVNILSCVANVGLGALASYEWLRIGMKYAKIYYGMDHNSALFNNELQAESKAIMFGAASSIMLMGAYYEDNPIDIVSVFTNFHLLIAESTLYLIGETINSSILEYSAGAVVGAQVIYNYSDEILGAGESLIEMGKDLYYTDDY